MSLGSLNQSSQPPKLQGLAQNQLELTADSENKRSFQVDGICHSKPHSILVASVTGSSREAAYLARRQVLTWVWAMTRMTWQYFFMLLKSFSSCFLPSSSCHFLQYLVKAFFLDLCLQEQSRVGEGGRVRAFIAQGARGRHSGTTWGWGSLPASKEPFPPASGAWMELIGQSRAELSRGPQG